MKNTIEAGRRVVAGVALSLLAIGPAVSAPDPEPPPDDEPKTFVTDGIQNPKAHAEAPPRPAAETCGPSDARRWLDSAPHSPMAYRHEGLNEANAACCADWGAGDRLWTTVDAYGQPTGRARVTDVWHYDVTDCDQFTFEQVEGKPGSGLYTVAGAKYVPPRSVKWAPSKAQVASLEKTLAEIDAVVGVDDWVAPYVEAGSVIEPPLAERALFFRAGPGKGDRFAVVGGLYLVVAQWRGDRWEKVYLDRSETESALDYRAYRPVAVFDMDGKAGPEIVFHELAGGGETFYDMVLTRDGQNWVELLRSIGGAVI